VAAHNAQTNTMRKLCLSIGLCLLLGLVTAHHDQYYNTTSETTTEQWIRFAKFLRRHNLYDQFLAEDAQQALDAEKLRKGN
jgi:hypothetical protein